MAINKEEIKITLSEGLQQVGEVAVEGRTATFRVKGIVPGAQTVKVKYGDNGTDVTEEITVVNIPDAGDLTAAKTTVEVGEKVKLTQAFDVVPELDDVTFELPEGVTEVPGSKQIEDTNVICEVTIGTAAEHTITTKYKTVGTGKSVTITGVNPEIEVVVASPDSIDEQAETTITTTFNELV